MKFRLRLPILAAFAFSTIFLSPVPARAQMGNDNPTGVTGDYNGSVTTGGSYDPYTGNAKRFVTDLTVTGSVGAYPLKWTRVLNSRGLPGPMGQGGTWRHSYQWGLWVRTPTGGYTPNQYEGSDGSVSYPDGRTMNLRQEADYTYEQADGLERLDRLVHVGGGNYDLVMQDGGRVQFEHPAGSTSGGDLRATKIVDPYGQTTFLTYDSSGRLSTVIEPAGRYLQINYTTFSYPTTYPPPATTRYVDVIASVQAFAAPGQLSETVTYNYTRDDVVAQYSNEIKYWNLTQVDYADGTHAFYTYSPSTFQGVPGRVVTCADVRFAGAMSKIAYEYVTEPETGNQAPVGKIKKEKNLTTGQTVSEVIYPAASTHTFQNPAYFQRTETRGDGTMRYFQYGIENGELESYTDFRNQRSYIGYSIAGNNNYVRTLTDARNNPTSSEKEWVAGAMMRVTHPDGSFFSFTYSDPANPYYVASKTDERSNVTYHDRDGNNRIWRTRYPDGSNEQFSYNGFGQVETHTMTSGGVENFRYDARGRKYMSWPPATPSDPNPQDHPTRYNYYENGPNTDRPLNVIDPRGNATWFEYNLRGQVTKVTHQDGSYVQSTYNPDGTLDRTIDELGHTTAYIYDEYKRVLTVTNALNQTTTNSYEPWSGIGSLSHTTSSVYWATSPSGKMTHFAYDENFRRTVVRQAPGTADDAWTYYAFDAVGNLISTTDPRGQPTIFGYDNRNRQTTVRDVLNQTTTTVYDAANNKTSVSRPGNPSSIRFVDYDPMNRLKEQIDEREVHTYFAYDDPARNLTSQRDGNNNTYSYTYDLLNRKTLMTYPGGSHEDFSYDAAGNMATHRNRAGAWQSFSYDNRNRNVWFDWNDGTQPQFTIYDAASRVTNLQNWEADITLTYDDANRKTSETEDIKSYGLYAQRSTVYQYDADGNRSRLVYPQGYEFIYGYTQRNQLDNIKLDPAIFGGTYNTPLVRYTYDLSGNRTTRTVLSGAYATYEIDPLNRIAGQWNYFTGSAGRFDYGFDAMGRRVFERRDFAPTDGYQYDPSDELTSYKRDGTLNGDGTVSASFWNSTGLIYDNNGNRSEMNGGATGTITYAHNSLNQYDSVSSMGSLGYDGKGNLASADGWTYGYDAQNRLTTMQGAGLTITMTYDPLNRVITRNVNGAVSQNVWDGWNLIEEHRPDWSLQRCYLSGANQNEMVASFDGNVYGTHWYWQDGRGNTSHITGDAANLFERYTYDLNGAPRFYDPNGSERMVSAYDTRFLFAGSQYLPDTGLYDMRNRFYHIGLNRFLQTDPIGFKGDAGNLYRYCGNDPVDRSDPMGLIDTAATLWRMNCFFDSGNSDNVSYNEFMGNNKPSSGMPSGNYNDPNIEHHVKTQDEGGLTKLTMGNVKSGVASPTLDWWVQKEHKDDKTILGELEHVSRNLWSLQNGGDLFKAIRKFNANPNGPNAKEKLENARQAEHRWHLQNLHGNPNRHDLNKNPKLWEKMTPTEIQNAIRNVTPMEDPRPQYLPY